MKFKKQILSFILAVMLVINCSPVVYASKDKVLIVGNIYDAIGNMEYGWDGTTYRFPDGILTGVENGDDVYLIADASIRSTETVNNAIKDLLKVGSKLSLSLTNFRLEGTDAGKYEEPTDLNKNPVNKNIEIVKKKIEISPEHPYIYYGQSEPENNKLTKLVDYKNEIVNNEFSEIQAEFLIVNPDYKVGEEYDVYLSGGIDTIGGYAGNHLIVVKDDLKFQVRKYETDKVALPNRKTNSDGKIDNYIGVNQVDLYAPEGFLISKNSTNWADKMTVNLEETDKGEYPYYLRNNNASIPEYYNAITEKKIYKYTSIQTKPEVFKVEINKTEPDKVLHFLTFGVFGNSEISVTVYAKGGKIPAETTIYLGENGAYKSKVVMPDEAVLTDEEYVYSAEYKFNVEEGNSIIKNFKAYAENVCGAGEIYPPAKSNDNFYTESGISDTKVNLPVTIDKKKPEVNILPINGNYNSDPKVDGVADSVKAEFTISDPDSGIAKIEYLWDKDAPKGDANYQNDYIELAVKPGNDSTYELIKPWSSLKKVEGNRHSLSLRVTDNAGNIYDEDPVFDKIGSDMQKPEIESIVIRDPRIGAINDPIAAMNCYEFGSFYRFPVDIIVKVNDHEKDKNYYASGVNKVFISNKNENLELKRIGETNEFVLRVGLNTKIEDLKITAIDGNGLSTTASAIEVPQHEKLQSNNLMIEQIPPIITFDNPESTGHKDNEGRTWFGRENEDNQLIVKISDNNKNSLSSGLQSVVIKDNETEFDSEYSFTYPTSDDERKYRIGDFSDGKHNFEVEAIDNCGNPSINTVTFYKDTMDPEKGKVSTVFPEGKTIDSKLWFDGKDNIIFNIDTSDGNGSGVKEISLTINKKSFVFNAITNDNIDDIVFDGDGKCHVQVSVHDVPHENQQFSVEGTITDFSQNSSYIEPLTVYKDFENPTIDKITVKKKFDVLDKILSVLTFGIYSNDKLIVKAYTYEPEFDSGIDYATIKYIGLNEVEKMTDEGNGVFSYEIPMKDEISENEVMLDELIVTVYDKYGNYSDNSNNSPKISSELDSNVFANENLVMIETVKPVITPNLPESEAVGREDDQVWYSKNRNIIFEFSDEHSGLNNVELTINGNEVTKDKNGVNLLKSVDAVNADTRNNAVQRYVFDTDYLASLCQKVEEDGKYVINAKATDNAGNVDSCIRTYYLDLKNPVINRIDFTPETVDGQLSVSEFIDVLEYGYYFKTDFKVTINVSDEGPSSGLNKVNYKLLPYVDGKIQKATTGSKEIVEGKAELMVPSGFKGQILVEAFDCVNRSSGEKTPKAYVVDTSAPEIKITNNVNTDFHDAKGNKLYVENNSFTVVITDTVSGIKQIGYSQASEIGAFERKIIDIANIEHIKGYDLGDGWIVTGVEANLVTQVTKVFTFDTDNNDVMLIFDATDNSLNIASPKQSDMFTVDKTAPIINVVFRDDDDTDEYYNLNRIADVTVIERNFDANLINVTIENTFGSVPTYSFEKVSENVHTAVIDFDEGDYTFDVVGTDLGTHNAIVNFIGGNEKLFFVDKTSPVIWENFAEFNNSAENSFNLDKTVDIRIVEHNFNPELVNLKIFRKNSGEEHNLNGFEDVTLEFLGIANWESTEDVHTISFILSRDAVYYVEITAVDLATNLSERHNSTVFEIDKTVPVVNMKNGAYVSRDNTSFLDVYPYERKDAAVPTVEFEDYNISYIKYKLSVYVLEHTASNDTVVNPVISEGIVEGNKYTLPEFKKDGVYAVELTAVDVAGNESLLNLNTYARMINQDVLAFIMDSNPDKKTGLYSFEYKNGQTISKKPSSFEDLKIFVMAKKDTPIDIVMRDANGKEINTYAQCIVDNSLYGIGIYNYLLKADFFKENFQDDVDIELILSVNNEGRRIDLGKMHIDNILPTSDIPKELVSWHWFFGEDERTFTLSNISELVNESQCKVYDNGNAIPFVYSDVDNTITFKLSKGWHNVGFVFVDMAGNTNNIQEVTNIHIGYFWLWIIIIALVIIIITTVSVLIHNRKRRRMEFEAV